MRCTNPYLPDGYRLQDHRGYDIAVLINGEFVRWAAGDHQPKSVREKFKKLKGVRGARLASRTTKRS